MEARITPAQVGAVIDGAELPGFGTTSADQAAAAVRTVYERMGAEVRDRTIIASLLNQIHQSADSAMALTNFHRFVEASPEPRKILVALRNRDEVLQAVVALMAGSQFLSDVLVSQPDLFEWLMDPETLHRARRADYYRLNVAAAIEGLSDRAAQRSAISRWRRKEYLRIGLRDLLLLADAEEVSRDISDLAEAIINQAAVIVYGELKTRFGSPVPELSSWEDSGEITEDSSAGTGMCVLGMGKLGGRELNFSSDIDLVFVYEAEGETTGRLDGGRRVAVISNHDFFTRMGEALVKFVGERGPDGHLFRVDMRLRPEGIDGPLVRSLESFLNYLNTQARDWERLAYLKARVVSGPGRLAEKLYRLIGDFVFAGLDARRIVSEVQEMKLRIDREVLISDVYHREVKRGYGGIREIEFVVAAMQIIHGYRHHALRVRNTFLAIQRLLEAHIISPDVASYYEQSYSFLRMVEHRLQMAQEAQTHTLPLPGAELDAMARRCGFNNGNEFMDEYRRVTDGVHAHFTAFFENDTEAIEVAARDILVLLDRSASPEEAREALKRRGLHDADALRLIHGLAYGTRDVFVSAEGQRSFEQMLPALLRLAADAPYPEKVLAHLHSFALAIKGITYYYEVIAQHPEILRLLVTLFGTSDSLSGLLISYPEFFDTLISSRILHDTGMTDEGRRERMATALTVRSSSRRLIMLRKAVHFERLVLGLQHLLQIRSLESCLAGLSHTADLAIEFAVTLAANKMLSRWNGTEASNDESVRGLTASLDSRICVIALGKYGGQELNFFGDLDVVFVYDDRLQLPPEATGFVSNPQEFYDSFADSLTAVMSEQMRGGRVFELDARLRPHGKNAPLTTALSTYKGYLESQAGTWELQAFHRARNVWGNDELLIQLRGVAREAAYRISQHVVQSEIVSMRARLEESVAGPGGDVLEVKRSPGGIVDIEFLIQYLVLTARLPWSQETANYYHVLRDLGNGVFGRRDAMKLSAAYLVLRGMENTVRLVSGGNGSQVPLDGELATAVSRSLSFGEAKLMAKEIKNVMAAVREIFKRYLA